jgi:homoserine dehydrogenase
MQTISVGLLGLGTVGTGVVRILRENAREIEARLGARIEVKRALIKDPVKERTIDVPQALLTTRAEDILDDPSVSIVVELVGGITDAKRFVLGAIDRKKHVVTANKALLAICGDEVFGAAKKNKVDVFYEAAVGGGIPIIRTLRESLASERVQKITAIVNGTTNFILSAMAEKGADFADMLKQAQKLGYAEADPSADVDGHDAAQKLAILAALGFSARVTAMDVEVEGIRSISAADMEVARRHGYAIKLLAVASRKGEAISAQVYPAWVAKTSTLANVNGALNGIQLESDALGTSVLIGKGAGELPTGSAVVADIIDLARNILLGSTGRVPLLAAFDEAMKPVRLYDTGRIEAPFYLRFSVADSPGVLARIAGALGEEGVSLRVVEQEAAGGSPVTIVVMTHAAIAAAVKRAIARIDAFETTRAPTQAMRIEAC